MATSISLPRHKMKPLIREIDNKYIEVIGHYDDQVLCAKMTVIADLFAIEKKEGYAKFKVEDADKLSAIDKNLKFVHNANEDDSNSISDLTGTTWIVKKAPQFTPVATYSVNFTAVADTETYKQEPHLEIQ